MTLSREQIATLIERKHPSIPKETAQRLGRDLHVALCGQTEQERDDEYIAAIVDAVKRKLEKSPDIVVEFNRFLHKSTTIPYIDQKILQWFIAYASSKGKK